MSDYVRGSLMGTQSSIVRLAITTNNFVIKLNASHRCNKQFSVMVCKIKTLMHTLPTIWRFVTRSKSIGSPMMQVDVDFPIKRESQVVAVDFSHIIDYDMGAEGTKFLESVFSSL